MALKAIFSGTAAPSNSLTAQGNGAYASGAPDFTVVALASDAGTYKMTVMNFSGVSGWPTRFNMTKSDSNPGDVIGTYDEDGGSGTAEVTP